MLEDGLTNRESDQLELEIPKAFFNWSLLHPQSSRFLIKAFHQFQSLLNYIDHWPLILDILLDVVIRFLMKRSRERAAMEHIGSFGDAVHVDFFKKPNDSSAFLWSIHQFLSNANVFIIYGLSGRKHRFLELFKEL